MSGESGALKPARLPPGRQAMSRERVRGNQRGRLVEATSRAMAGRSYAELSISHITDEAGVSRATFYQLFDGKRECVLAAYELAGERLVERLAAALEG